MIGGRLYVFGGFYNAALQASKRVDVYDPVTGLWSNAADMPVAITHIGLAVDGTYVWCAGGFQGDHPGPTVASVRKYDTVTNTWSNGPALPEPRAGGALVRLGSELHYFGGVLVDRNTDSGSHWVLDLTNQSLGWAARAPLPDPRNHLSGAVVGSKIYALGGQHNHDVNPLPVVSAHSYDASADAWTAVASLPLARSHAEPGTSVYNGRILLAGGYGQTTSGLSFDNVAEFDPATNTWSTLLSLPLPLVAPVAHPIGNQYVLSLGGATVNEPQARSWRHTLGQGPPSVRRIDAGSTVTSIQSGPTLWCPDEGFQGGGTNVIPPENQIANTQDDHLYRSERSGTDTEQTYFKYAFPAASGYYRILLHFAELYWGAPGGGPGGIGQRVFDVRLEGATLLDDYDVTADAGAALTAAVKTFERPVGDGTLDLEFEASVNRPTIAAIEVIELSANSIVAYCTTSPNSVGPGATTGWDGSTSLANNDLVVTVAGGPPFKVGRFLFGSQPDQTPFGDGVSCVSGDTFRLPLLMFDASGTARTTVDFTTAPASVITPGSVWHFQCRYRDPFGPGGSGFNSSDALMATFWP